MPICTLDPKIRLREVKLAIGNDLAVAEGFEPSHGRINSAVPYHLGYATKELAAATRFELAHPRLQDERSLSN